MNKIIIFTAALASVMTANCANAATLLVSLTRPDGNGTFIIDSNPVLLSSSAESFITTIRDGTGRFYSTPLDSAPLIAFFTEAAGGGFSEFVGPQVFSGPTAMPTILTGTFVSRSNNAIRATITDVAAAIPEPATWTMLLVGFGLIGAATRYRRKGVQVRYA